MDTFPRNVDRVSTVNVVENIHNVKCLYSIRCVRCGLDNFDYGGGYMDFPRLISWGSTPLKLIFNSVVSVSKSTIMLEC